MDFTAKAKFVVSSLSEKILIYVTEMCRSRESGGCFVRFLLLHYRIVDRPGENFRRALATSIWRYIRTSVPS